jgi:hypothetical protein
MAAQAQAQNIDEVVDGLAGIVREATAAGDRIGYFAALYRQVTVEIRKAIHALEHDFLLINDILAGVVLVLEDSLGAISPLLSLLDKVGGRTDEEILDFSVVQSRQEAWYNAVLLAGQTDAEREATIDRLDVRAAVLARLIARPGLLVRPALELIRGTESGDVPAVIGHLDGAMERASAGRPTTG